jgi:hypothetical protein
MKISTDILTFGIVQELASKCSVIETQSPVQSEVVYCVTKIEPEVPLQSGPPYIVVLWHPKIQLTNVLKYANLYLQ